MEKEIAKIVLANEQENGMYRIKVWTGADTLDELIVGTTALVMQVAESAGVSVGQVIEWVKEQYLSVPQPMSKEGITRPEEKRGDSEGE